jgi:hypothetical protein
MRLIDADAFKMEDFRHCLDCDSIIQVIKYAPTIEAEPVKHGRWLQPKSGECFCSECKTLGSPQWKRCPVCEAKMDGGENDA